MTTYKTKLRTYRILKIVFGDDREKYYCEYRTIPYKLYFFTAAVFAFDISLYTIHLLAPTILLALTGALLTYIMFTREVNWSTCTSKNCDVPVFDVEYYQFYYLEEAQMRIRLLMENDELIIQRQQSEKVKKTIPL